ncbi:MAG: ATP-dependent DNA ligase [Microbacterium sp.]
MGRFIYEGGQRLEVEDRALTHLQLVITSKLRRAEPFPFSWRGDPSTGGGKTTVWVHAQSSLVFQYYGSRRPSVNPAWVDALAYTAHSSSGLYLVPEPAGSTTTGAIVFPGSIHAANAAEYAR